MMANLTASVRMYRLNELGDCFLLTFVSDAHKSRMLIDCGSFRNSSASKARLQKIVANIQSELDESPLDVVVGTHQHNDHLSGFVHCESAFRKIGVNQVWLSWLDDSQDRMAQGIGATHNNLKLALFKARTQLQSSRAESKGLQSLRVLEDVLGFYGANKGTGTPPVLPADAVGVLKSIGQEKPRYLKPGNVLEMPGLPQGTVRVYVLGPPRDNDLLYRKDPRTGESYDHALVSAQLAADKFLAAAKSHRGSISSDEAQYPFNEIDKRRSMAKKTPALRKVIAAYNSPDGLWRKIDDDWLNQAEALALYLDTFTNNTSVVLAIELVESKKVLLFAADAQVGNWRSWPNVKWEKEGVTTDDLLARTVLYKVGHHASHNATLVEALEKMNRPDLSALIPVHKKDPNITKSAGWKMPARNLFKRLVEKTSGRVLQMDGINPESCDPQKSPAALAWKKLSIKPKQTALYMQIDFRDT
jgi:beta-lactamase superfamily II metal-dependent hydrolase